MSFIAHKLFCKQNLQPQIASSATVNGGRINIAACSIGGAQFCVDTAQEYVQTRVQFTQPIAGFQNTAFKLADMTTAVQASRLMVRCSPQLCSRITSAACTVSESMHKATEEAMCTAVSPCSSAAVQACSACAAQELPYRVMPDICSLQIASGLETFYSLFVYLHLQFCRVELE